MGASDEFWDTDLTNINRWWDDIHKPTPWVKWFAILPVKLKNGKLAWFKTVYMRQVWEKTESYQRVTEYGTMFDILKE